MKTALRITSKAKDAKEVWPATSTNGTSIELCPPDVGIGISAKVIRVIRPGAEIDVTMPSTRTYLSDTVFEPRSTQFDVYKSIGIPIVSEVIKGDKIATMIAYGAEGSGKSHTMFGTPAIKDESRGILIRIIDSIYTRSAMMLSDETRLAISCVEVTHADEVVDLLKDYVVEEGITKRKVSPTLPYDWSSILLAGNVTACECGAAGDVVKVLAAGLSTTSTAGATTSFLQRKADRVILLEVVRKNSYILAVDCSPLYCKSMHTLKDIVAFLAQSKCSNIDSAPFQKSKLAQLLRHDIIPSSTHMTRLLLHCRASSVDVDNFDTHSVMHVSQTWKSVRAYVPSSGESPAKSANPTTTPPTTAPLKFTASFTKPHSKQPPPSHESPAVAKMAEEEAKAFTEAPPQAPVAVAPTVTVLHGENMVFDLSSSSSSDEMPTRPSGGNEASYHNTPSDISSNASDNEPKTPMSPMKHKLLATKYKKLKGQCRRYGKMYAYAKEQWDHSNTRVEDANAKNQEIVQKNVLLMTRYEEAKRAAKLHNNHSGVDRDRLLQIANDNLRTQQRATPMFQRVFMEYEKLLADLRAPNASETDALRSNLRAMMQVVEQTGEENGHLAELSTKLNGRLVEAHRRLEEYELNEQEYITREEQYMDQITTLQRQVTMMTTYRK